MNKKAIQYSIGEVLNKETGTKKLEEIPVEKGQPRKAKCKCGYCGNENFIVTIKKAKAGQLCSLCKSERLSLTKIKYKDGDVLNKETGSILLKRDSNNKLYGDIRCGRCGKTYYANISDVVQGHLCSKCGGKKQSVTRAKYLPGDIITAKNGVQFFFKEELKPKYDAENHKRRIGLFYKVIDGKILYDKPITAGLNAICSGDVSGKNISNAMVKIENILSDNHISFSKEQTFDGLSSYKNNNYSLKIDFVIWDSLKTIGIEVDGEQHSRPVEFFGGEQAFYDRKMNDSQKNKYFENRENFVLLRFLDKDVLKQNFEKEFIKLIDDITEEVL